MNEDLKILRKLYSGRYGCEPCAVTRLSAAGGDRVYFRMASEAGECIGTVGDSERDCQAFVSLSSLFRNYGIDVPEVYAVSEDGMHYLQQDLGPESLFDLLRTDRWRPMAEKTVRALVRLHQVPASEVLRHVRYEPFYRRQAMWDLNYFKYEYLRPLRIPFNESALEDDFERFADWLDSPLSGPRNFMMRDCQSRNVMVYDDKPWFIDFQGGRFGPVVYDLVSLLWQAKAQLSMEERKELVDLYVDLTAQKTGVDAAGIYHAVTPLVLFRTLQVLGAYGFRGLVEHRAHFIESIPKALENLRQILDDSFLDNFPELRNACRYAVEHNPVPVRHDGMTVKVFSFSYKLGYPTDLSGNGGGFMFDCRGMHNPGRYDEYKRLTGLDKPVRDFLEERGEVQNFIMNALQIVSPSVDCYLRRGFNDLQVGFGCTGGRHRSVYCCDGFAKKLKERYPDVNVRIIHREQGIEEVL